MKNKIDVAVERFANELIALRQELSAGILAEVKKSISAQLKKVQA